MKLFESGASHVRGVVAAALLIQVAAACGGAATPAADPDASAPPTALSASNIATVARGRLESGPMISGALAPERQATLRAEIGGPVVATSAERGQVVARGELLARLDDAEIQIAYLSAKSALTATEFDASVAKREEERAASLVAAGALAQRELDQAKRMNVAAQAQLADAQSRMALAEKQRTSTRIVAPFAGVISEKHISGGDVVQPGNALYTIIDPASMRLEASVPAHELGSVKSGSNVRFTVSGYGSRSFTGRVSRVSPAADASTGQILVIVSVPNAGQALVSGLFAEGRIAAQSREALLAPAGAINLSGPVPSVLRVRQGRVEKVDVVVGQKDAATEMVEVMSGLELGDTLLLGSARGIEPGAAVKMGSTGDSAVRKS